MSPRQTPLAGLLVFEQKIHRDERGFFTERFRAERLRAAGITEAFVQDNHSRSVAGVLRGLHFQPGQGKFVSTTRGRVWDVAVDLRRGSSTFGQHFGIELSDENGLALWIPSGFAHGFCVLGEESADLVYKVTAYYDAKAEGGVKWNDPTLAVVWPLAKPQVSARDESLPSLAAISPL